MEGSTDDDTLSSSARMVSNKNRTQTRFQCFQWLEWLGQHCNVLSAAFTMLRDCLLLHLQPATAANVILASTNFHKTRSTVR